MPNDQREALGPAEHLIQTLLTFNDHMVHNRPGVIETAAGTPIGVKWSPVTHKVEDGKKIVYKMVKQGKKNAKVKFGTLWADNTVRDEARHKLGEYRPAGLYPEVAEWMYKQVAEVWKLDNEFAARWASYAYREDHRDLKVVLAAFMLVQSRKGDPEREDGQIVFHDEDYRDVGEAMMLLKEKGSKTDLNPKLLLRIRDFLRLPKIAEINRELGFGRSARRPFLGRWDKAVTKWLQYREDNIPMLEGLVKAGFRSTVRGLAQRVGYKPSNPRFFEILRWKQAQSKEGHRDIAIGVEVAAAETWAGLSETEICERIMREKPGFKRIAGMVPANPGMTRAVVAAAIEAGSLSDKDLVIYTPTLEDLGLLKVQDIRDRWERAIKNAEDMRAANIATRVKSQATKDKLEEAADEAVKKAVEEDIKNLRVYFYVDISGSMEGSIEAAKEYIAKFLGGFPPEQIHIAIFNTSGREITLPHASAAGARAAFRGIRAGGGTDYGAGVRCLQKHKAKENEDVLFVFIGDEAAPSFTAAVQRSGLNPLAFGLIKIVGQFGWGGNAVTATAEELGIPCFEIKQDTFADPYAIPRTIRNLIAATPVGQAHTAARVVSRVTLVDKILDTQLLIKPVWAA
jgi:von Willebrand factor type A domain